MVPFFILGDFFPGMLEMGVRSESFVSVASARRKLVESDWEADEACLRALLGDPRAGIRALGERVRARRRKSRAEDERLGRMLRIEALYWERGSAWIAGLDEAGRGSLAGPVVAAAVVLRRDSRLPGVDDSKRLSPRRREDAFPLIFREAHRVGVGVVWHEDVDRINIRQATFLAMRGALGRLGFEPDLLLVDGEPIPNVETRQEGIPNGDGLSLSIAAASVVAKVVRDRIMTVLDRKHPGYGFGRHKGYGTDAHRRAIARLGLCPVHRRTFCAR